MDGRRSIARIADVIRASGADIACLQEVEQRVTVTGYRDQPRRLARLLGMHTEFQAAMTLPLYKFGNLILTRYPVLRVTRHALTSAGEPRGLLEAQLQSEVGTLSVFCTHWGLNAQERLIQAAETADIVNASAPPRVICGDLNETPDCAAVQSLILKTGLRDLALAAVAPEPTFPSDAPRVRIDYILAGPEVEASDMRVIDSLASDHRPVAVVLTRGC